MKPSSTSALDPVHKTDLIQWVVDATRKAMGLTIDELTETGVLNDSNIQRVRTQGDRIVAGVTARVKETLAELAENIVDRLKLISGAKKLVLKPTTGERTIANATKTFRSYIDSDFVNWRLDIAGRPRVEMPLQVYEQVKNGTYSQIFGGVSDNLDSLCLSQEQVIAFCETHGDWLRANFWTHFLFKVGDKFFVAIVRVDPAGLYVYVSEFSLESVWFVEDGHRFVIPQLTV